MNRLRSRKSLQFSYYAKAGFSLLEVMLAVTILAVGLVMVVRSQLTSLSGIKTSQNLSMANLLLEEKIWEKREEQVRLAGVSFFSEENEFTSPFDKFSYEINSEEEENLPPEYRALLNRANFEVSWQQRNRRHSSSCVTFLRSREE